MQQGLGQIPTDRQEVHFQEIDELMDHVMKWMRLDDDFLSLKVDHQVWAQDDAIIGYFAIFLAPKWSVEPTCASVAQQ